jgi:hypothetical protein
MIDVDRAMAAIKRVESSDGHNNYPRFEAAYAPKGETFTVQGHLITGTGACWNAIVAKRWAQYGMASACSFSSYQILAHTAMDIGFADVPWALWDDRIAATYVRRKILGIIGMGATTIEQLADAWNSGSFKDGIIPTKYIADVRAAYDSLEPTTPANIGT